MKVIELPKDILFGSATAATQIEGGDYFSNWYQWSLQGKIANNESSIVAADHWNRVEEDIQIMKELNQEVYRMSIEWSRFEPREGQWSEAGIQHYIDEIDALLEAGIKPLITLHHFSHPQWFEEMGAWSNARCLYYFKRFVGKVLEAIGDKVSEYCTINEPNVFVNDTYMDGKYPPGAKDDIFNFFKAADHMIRAHIRSYQQIHEYRRSRGYDDTRVGMAIHLAYFDVHGDSPLTKFSKVLMDHSFHKMFMMGMIEGKLTPPIGIGYPYGKGIYCDFIGVNYYSRHLIHSSLNPATLFGQVKVEEGLSDEQVNDLGWEIYPQGMYEVIKASYDRYQLPIFITENGIPDHKDAKRAKFIYDHMVQLKRLVDDGVKVERYYHWSLLDNLEWNDGYEPRFGLVEVDFETQKRSIRDSGRFYGDLCKHKAVTEAMIDRYF